MKHPLVLGMVGLTLAGCLSLAPGCGRSSRWVRVQTYPDDFEYLSGGELETAMGRLAAAIRELEARLAAEPTLDPAALEPILARIESQARGLRHGGGGSNHPDMDEPLDDLLARVDRAQHDLQRRPPEYAEVESLPDACTSCHVRR